MRSDSGLAYQMEPKAKCIQGGSQNAGSSGTKVAAPRIAVPRLPPAPRSDDEALMISLDTQGPSKPEAAAVGSYTNHDAAWLLDQMDALLKQHEHRLFQRLQRHEQSASMKSAAATQAETDEDEADEYEPVTCDGPPCVKWPPQWVSSAASSSLERSHRKRRHRTCVATEEVSGLKWSDSYQSSLPSKDALTTNDLQRCPTTTSIDVEDSERRAEAMRHSFSRQGSQTDARQRSCARAISRLVSSSGFELAVAVAIMTNAVLIGFEVEYFARNLGADANPPLFITLVNCIFAGIFTFELLLRVTAERGAFLRGPNRNWNIFDVVLVMTSLFETVIDILIASNSMETSGLRNFSSLRIVRMIRFTRFVRSLRLSRVIRFVSALRTLVHSIFVTLKSLIWVLLLLFMIMYVFGVVFTQSASDHFTTHGRDPVIDQYWGSMVESMYTLFKAFTGGVDWHDAVTPLEKISFALAALFTGFIFFVYFAVLNVVTGVFCQSAIETTQCDPDLAAHTKIVSRRNYIRRLKQLFTSVDTDCSGSITVGELEKLFTDERMLAHISALDLDANDAWTVFKHLDSNRNNVIDLDEFVMGIMRLRGAAKGVDLHTLIVNHQRLVKRLSSFMRYVDLQFQNLKPMASLQS